MREENTPEVRFTWREKSAFFRKKWRKDHRLLILALALALAGLCAVGLLLRNGLLVFLAFALAVIVGVALHNAMMIYVERNAFDGSGE